MNNYYAGPEFNKESMESLKSEHEHMQGMENMKCSGCPEVMQCPIQTQCCDPIYECPEERVEHRYINYEVPQEW